VLRCRFDDIAYLIKKVRPTRGWSFGWSRYGRPETSSFAAIAPTEYQFGSGSRVGTAHPLLRGGILATLN